MKICEDRHALVGDFQYSIFIIYYLSIWEKVSEWVDDLPKDLHHRYLFVKIVTHGLVTFSTQSLLYIISRYWERSTNGSMAYRRIVIKHRYLFCEDCHAWVGDFQYSIFIYHLSTWGRVNEWVDDLPKVFVE